MESFQLISNLNESSRRSAAYRHDTYQFAIDYARTHPDNYKFEPHNLGDAINSAVSEYFPSISLDGDSLFYTRRVGGFNEDFFGSHRSDTGWSVAHALAGNINSNNNEGALNISQDGQWLIFTGCNFPEGFGSCDLYISYLTPQGWSTPENMGRNFNTDAWESAPSLSPDKRDLYFASSRVGGFGGSDLYVSHRLDNGRWTPPENMGAGINTAGDESAPFIHADNATLYYTSDGLPGYGGQDLFVIRKTPEGGWTVPENLGFPINTIENEGSLVVASDGKTAYYASDRSDSRGQLDLYGFELRSDIRPSRTFWAKGRVYDAKTNKGLPTSVELSDLAGGQLISKLQTDETGNYLITLPAGKDYVFTVKRKGYLFYSGRFQLAGGNRDTTDHLDIPLQPIEANASIVLKNIFFDNNQYDLKPASQIELAEVVQLLRENPKVSILISGHTDNVGGAKTNLLLSENRAKAVVAYLTAQGIAAARLSAKGFGDTQPVKPNDSEAGKAMNRRTELKVIKAD